MPRKLVRRPVLFAGRAVVNGITYSVALIADAIDRIVILHRHFLVLLITAYALAALLPGLGQHLRHLTLGEVAIASDQIKLSVPFILLAFLQLNAGSSTETLEI